MKKEYVITILGDGKRRRRRGRVGRFGRSEYLSRRGSGVGEVVPFLLNTNIRTQVPGITDVMTENYNATTRVPSNERGLWPYSIRNGDLLMIVMRRDGVTVGMDGGWSVKSFGIWDIWWKYWHTGDPYRVHISVSGTPYVPSDPYRYDSGYWDGFWMVARGVGEVADPFTAVATVTGSGTQIVFGQVQTPSETSLLMNICFHDSRANRSGTTYFYDPYNPKTAVSYTDQSSSGAVRAQTPGWFGVLSGLVEEKGGSGATQLTAPASGAWWGLSFALPKITPTPKESVTGSALIRLTHPPVRPGDIVIRAGYAERGLDANGWTMVPCFPDNSNGADDYEVWWKRWKEGDTKDWTAGPGLYGQTPLVTVVQNGPKSGNPFSAWGTAGGYGKIASTPAVTAKKGELAIFIVQHPTTLANNLARYRFDQLPLERFDNHMSPNAFATVGSGYVGADGTVPSITTTKSYNDNWQSTVLVLKKP